MLAGHERFWGVAMDNAVDLPGYKAFVDERTGERPAVLVAFLDLVPDAATAVEGLALPVAPAALAALDRRERNYARADVTALVDAPVAGPVHAYVGLPAARERCARGRREQRAVVSRAYRDAVLAAYARLGGPAAVERFHASTEPPGLPLRDLRAVASGAG